MRDILHKISTRRTATALAVLKLKPESIAAIRENSGPKKDILATARAASFLAVKNTPSVIPLCHPLPVEAVETEFEFGDDELRILLTASTIYKTGCEVEAMHGASVAALVIYDMLKPIDKSVEIAGVRLLEKSGGKSDWRDRYPRGVTAGLIVCSDTVASGQKEDRAGRAIAEALSGFEVDLRHDIVVPDDPARIRAAVEEMLQEGIQLILTCGGTGLGPRDSTPEALRPLIQKEIPGIMEAARAYGQERMPWAMLSRSVAGLHDRSLILTLPGSTGGAKESMQALFPYVLHIFEVLEKGYRHLPPNG